MVQQRWSTDQRPQKLSKNTKWATVLKRLRTTGLECILFNVNSIEQVKNYTNSLKLNKVIINKYFKNLE